MREKMLPLRIALTTIFTIVSFTLSLSQTVRIADNNFNAPTGPNIFPTLQAAVNAADPGDIIYVQPSPTRYGSLTSNKRLIIKGIGFNLDKDIPHQSTITNITLTNNTDNTSNASGTEIEGLTVSNIFLAPRISSAYALDDIVIKNCRTSVVAARVDIDNLLIVDTWPNIIEFFRRVTNSEIRNNLIASRITMGSITASSLIITNNIIFGTVSKSSVGDNLIIQNNNFIGTRLNTDAFGNMRDAVIANNIFYGRTPSITAAGNSSSTNFQRNIFTNNLSYETGNNELPPSGGGVGNSGDGNIEGNSPLFVNVPLLNTWAEDYDFTLQASSPALNAGSDGSDIGISGGPYAWTESNFSLNTTPLPTIQIFNTTTVINPGDDLSVRVKAKGN